MNLKHSPSLRWISPAESMSHLNEAIQEARERFEGEGGYSSDTSKPKPSRPLLFCDTEQPNLCCIRHIMFCQKENTAKSKNGMQVTLTANPVT
jgi:hypothetical protein